LIKLISEDDVKSRHINYIIFPHCLDPNDKRVKIRNYELKVDISHLSNNTLDIMDRMLLEEKWFCNYCVSQDDIYQVNYKIGKISVKVKDVYEERDIIYLSAQMKQETVNRLKDNIDSLSTKKEKGQKVGKLKPKSDLRSIPLIQYGNTYKILNNKYIMIQGIKQKIRVRGLWQILDQIPDGIEVASAVLIKRHGDFYIHITTYIMKKDKAIPFNHIGNDFGITRQVTLSNGIGIEYEIPINDKIRKLHQELDNKEYKSQNWYKAKDKLEKAYEELTNLKGDIKNKIVRCLKDNFQIVSYQNDPISGWQRIWGRKILSTGIGETKSMLKPNIQTPIEIEKWFPSTKTCCKCGHKYNIKLKDRIYICQNKECGNIMDRDLNSAKCLDDEGLRRLSVGTERIDFKPEEIKTNTLNILDYLNKIPYVTANLVDETGSSLL